MTNLIRDRITMMVELSRKEGKGVNLKAAEAVFAATYPDMIYLRGKNTGAMYGDENGDNWNRRTN